MGRARRGASDLPGTEAVRRLDEAMSRELEVLHHRAPSLVEPSFVLFHRQ
jgi:hypothetical protein